MVNDFKSQKIYTSQKYDLEFKLDELQNSWQQDEMEVLLEFLNSMCENCFKPAQLFLRRQVFDEQDVFEKVNAGKITSIDMIY